MEWDGTGSDVMVARKSEANDLCKLIDIVMLDDDYMCRSEQ